MSFQKTVNSHLASFNDLSMDSQSSANAFRTDQVNLNIV